MFRLLHRHQFWLILGFRFLYGIRVVTPFIIGASGMKPARFLLLDLLGGLIWSVVIGVAGYLFGQTLEVLLGDLKKDELAVFAVLCGPRRGAMAVAAASQVEGRAR